jgi:hypothetical protein
MGEVAKWVAVIVFVLVAGAIANFAIYTFGWRDDANENERARAQAAAEQVAAQCEKECTVSEITRIAPRLWRSREVDTEGRVFCVVIDLDYFRVASNAETVHGASEVTCPGRSGR